MKTTEYLTGYPGSHYEAELKPLRKKRIDDMTLLKKKLTVQARHLDWDSKEYREIQTRYDAIVEAIEHWNNL